MPQFIPIILWQIHCFAVSVAIFVLWDIVYILFSIDQNEMKQVYTCKYYLPGKTNQH